MGRLSRGAKCIDCNIYYIDLRQGEMCVNCHAQMEIDLLLILSGKWIAKD